MIRRLSKLLALFVVLVGAELFLLMTDFVIPAPREVQASSEERVEQPRDSLPATPSTPEADEQAISAGAEVNLVSKRGVVPAKGPLRPAIAPPSKAGSRAAPAVEAETEPSEPAEPPSDPAPSESPAAIEPSSAPRRTESAGRAAEDSERNHRPAKAVRGRDGTSVLTDYEPSRPPATGPEGTRVMSNYGD